MNVQPRYPTTADEFLSWNMDREGKREFVRGRVVELMINVTYRHARLAARLVVALARQLPDPPYSVGSADFGVRTKDGVRYPDVFVDQQTAATRGTDLTATQPVILVEIVSPSSFTRDFGEKFADYTGIDSLHHYIIVAQDEPRIWLWSRTSEGEWQGPVQIAGLDAT